ncbi:hypothetical protein NY551_18230 [Curtobacterium flaccumfaciens pv. oortii]|uniref:hypothetical protein n=1 Tax=Curtobacterium flaccumfaciens TaxID=2035 RepID=UPI002659D469|nr:hypothetical protein [Curtobacterium flaccumfaciens]MCS5524675.1 hypothetical protein [Curtobacterium flaccumfaciens pv. oortii]
MSAPAQQDSRARDTASPAPRADTTRKTPTPPFTGNQTPVVAVLRAATAAETTATGRALREAFRTTRHLLAGARSVGISVPELAATLGVSAGALRARSDRDGDITVDTFLALSGLTMETLEAWQQDQFLSASTHDEFGRPSYAASALLRALMMTRQPPDGDER